MNAPPRWFSTARDTSGGSQDGRGSSARAGGAVEKESFGRMLFPQCVCYTRYKLYKFSSLQRFLSRRKGSARSCSIEV